MGPTVWGHTVSNYLFWNWPTPHWIGGLQFRAYSLGAYSLELPILELAGHSLDWGPTVWGGYNLGAYSLGAYSLELPILELADHSLDWGPTVWGPTVWGPTVSNYRFWNSPAKPLFLRNDIEDP